MLDIGTVSTVDRMRENNQRRPLIRIVVVVYRRAPDGSALAGTSLQQSV
jgi:hypothetical protein